MDWQTLLAYITGTVDQELLLRNEYVVTENRMLRRSRMSVVLFQAMHPNGDKMSDATGIVSEYIYDKAGNFLEIRRLRVTGLAILTFAPQQGPVGTDVTLQGQDSGTALSEIGRVLQWVGVVGRVGGLADDATGTVLNTLSIATQKQAGHISDTPQNFNRLKMGKPTSMFFGEKSGERLTQEAWKKGRPLLGRPNIREYDFGFSTGTGLNGGMQTRVRVHQDARGRIHGHPSGPERF